MDPFYQDDTVTLYHGDSLEVAASLPNGSVDCIVTSPPYYGLRDYGSDGQYGLEETPAAYVENMRALFSELRRTLAKDGTLWLNLGDSYGKNKSMLGMPWRVAFALMDDGWILRNDVVWNKPNAMPESVTDRLSCRYEHVFLFSKSQRYWFDLDPIRLKLLNPDAADGSRVFGGSNKADLLVTGSAARRTGNVYVKKVRKPDEKWNAAIGSAPNMREHSGYRGTHDDGKNPGDVWNITTSPFPGAHFAVFPNELARRCIVAGCKPGGVVLDPFSGSGTTGSAAQENGRTYVGIDISDKYLNLSLATRLRERHLF